MTCARCDGLLVEDQTEGVAGWSRCVSCGASVPPLSEADQLTYRARATARREARKALAPLKYGAALSDPLRLIGTAIPLELTDVDAKIAELQRVRTRLIATHGEVNVG